MALDDVIEIIETLFKIITFLYLALRVNFWNWFGAILGRSNVTKWADNG